MRWERPHERGEFKREIVPVYGRDEEGKRFLAAGDQCVRFDATMDVGSLNGTNGFAIEGVRGAKVRANVPS